MVYAPNHSSMTAPIPDLYCLTTHKADTWTYIKLGKVPYTKSLQNMKK